MSCYEAILFKGLARSVAFSIVRLRRSNYLNERSLDRATIVRSPGRQHVHAVGLTKDKFSYLLINSIGAVLRSGSGYRLANNRPSVPGRSVGRNGPTSSRQSCAYFLSLPDPIYLDVVAANYFGI